MRNLSKSKNHNNFKFYSIFSFGHEKEVAVSKAHRHFDLDPSEVMVELDDNGCKDGQITKPMLLDKVQDKVQPNVLAFDTQTGQFYPVNFGDFLVIFKIIYFFIKS